MVLYQIPFVILFVICCYRSVSAIHIETVPQKFNDMLTPELSVTCVADGPAYWAKTVLTIKLGKKGEQPMAIYNSVMKVTKGPGMADNMQADGRIVKDASKSFLRLTIKNPGSKDAGTYRCVIYYLDESFQMKQVENEANVTVDNQDLHEWVKNLMAQVLVLQNSMSYQQNVTVSQGVEINTQRDKLDHLTKAEQGAKEMVKNLMARVLVLEHTLFYQQNVTVEQAAEIDRQGEKSDHLAKKNQDVQEIVKTLIARVSGLEHTLSYEQNVSVEQGLEIDRQGDKLDHLAKKDQDVQEIVNTLIARVSVLENSMSYQQNVTVVQGVEINRQGDKLDHLVKKENISSAFQAGYMGPENLSIGQTLTFRNVQENIGNNFDGETGIYTAPVDGLYAFHHFLMSYGGGQRDVQVSLVVENFVVARLMAEHNDHYDQSSVSCVVSLKAGETVKCKVNNVWSNSIKLHIFPYTGFSGHLIHVF